MANEANEAKKAEGKAILVKLGKLHEALVELKGKEQAILDEMETLLTGGVGIGAILRRLEAHFSECWAVRYRGPYGFHRVKDVPQLKRLIKLLGVEEIERRMITYLKNDEPFFCKPGVKHSFGAFVATVNQHTTGDLLNLDAAGAEDVAATNRMLAARSFRPDPA